MKKIQFVGVVEKKEDGKNTLYRKYYFRVLLPDGRTVNSTKLLRIGEDEKALYRQFEKACLEEAGREKGKDPSPLRLAGLCRDLTLSEVMDLHRDAKADYEEATGQYHRYLRKRIDEALGAKKICNIQVWQLDEFSRRLAREPNRLTGKPLSRVTVHRVQAFLVQIFRWAFRKGYIDEDPTLRMERFRKAKSRTGTPGRQVVDDLVVAVQREAVPRHYRIFFYLLLYTGMRREEVLGLRWSDVDFSEKHDLCPAGQGQGRRERLPGEGAEERAERAGYPVVRTPEEAAVGVARHNRFKKARPSFAVREGGAGIRDRGRADGEAGAPGHVLALASRVLGTAGPRPGHAPHAAALFRDVPSLLRGGPADGHVPGRAQRPGHHVRHLCGGNTERAGQGKEDAG